MQLRASLLSLGVFVALVSTPVLARQAVNPPPGFVALYNGKNLDGWRGGDTQDHRKYLAMAPDVRAKQDADWLADVNLHWRADGPELVNDGKGRFLTTVKEYGDFEVLVDYKALPLGD
ncbi:MAG: DUF1080 domain-containing protein, partial [Acidobacteria bacterium]|nr:DUF1080 domain-containing protein [Acidobacteriota bacterium]